MNEGGELHHRGDGATQEPGKPAQQIVSPNLSEKPSLCPFSLNSNVRGKDILIHLINKFEKKFLFSYPESQETAFHLGELQEGLLCVAQHNGVLSRGQSHYKLCGEIGQLPGNPYSLHFF